MDCRTVHLLVLTRVLIYRNERNEKYVQYGGFCECGNDLHRSVKDESHSNSARNGLLFCETLRSHTGADADYVLSTGERLRTFRWNAVTYYWTVGPEDKGELTGQ